MRIYLDLKSQQLNAKWLALSQVSHFPHTQKPWSLPSQIATIPLDFCCFVFSKCIFNVLKGTWTFYVWCSCAWIIIGSSRQGSYAAILRESCDWSLLYYDPNFIRRLATRRWKAHYTWYGSSSSPIYTSCKPSAKVYSITSTIARALPRLNKYRPSYVIIGLVSTDKKGKLNKERIHPQRLKWP
jgi:hypothetical protein